MQGFRLPKAGVLLAGQPYKAPILVKVAGLEPFTPNEHYRYAFKKGMDGWDVWAMQIGLNCHPALTTPLVEDGAFGPVTEAAAKTIQKALGVSVDGIVGGETQWNLCSKLAANSERHISPTGLLKGIIQGESGGYLATTSPLYPDGSRDYGAYQDNMRGPTAGQLREAFNLTLQGARLAQYLKAKATLYRGGGVDLEHSWRWATLSYNWPSAADQIAAGHGDTWVYTESGSGIKRHLADPAPWIESYKVPGVRTGWDWCRFYVESKVMYVTSWVV